VAVQESSRQAALAEWGVVAIAVAIAAVTLVGAAACSGGSPSAAGSAAAGPLDHSRWRLTGWTVSSLDPASVSITANFAGGQISGNSGVNTYSGPCTVGPGDAFATGDLASTMMAGPEPAMRAETAYMTLLGQARSYSTDGGTLTLYDEGGNPSLIFGPTK
jgi:heat shock protein HslJ